MRLEIPAAFGVGSECILCDGEFYMNEHSVCKKEMICPAGRARYARGGHFVTFILVSAGST